MSAPRLKRIVTVTVLCAALAAMAAAASGSVSAGAGPVVTVDPTSLPLGDGRISTSGPRRGYVYICQASRLPPGGAGAFAEGPWIHSDGTFDLTAKATVDGAVDWPEAWFETSKTARRRLLKGNGLPTRQSTGQFPIASSDDAYNYDRNPNSISAQSERYSLPLHPRRSSRAHCLSGGPVGVARNGVPIFDALDALDRDAVAHEVQDECDGHPQQQGMYHYHSIPSCLTAGEPVNRASGLIGYALDGYPIYGPRGAGGRLLTDADLDACHGQVSKVRFEGRWQRIYHYNATLEYPYTLGCFRGAPQSAG